MSDDPPSLRRTLAVLAAIVAAWWILPGVVRRVARETFYEFQAPLFLAESRLRDLRRYWEYESRPAADLIEAGRDLARVNADLSLRLAQTDALAAENRRLEATLGLPSRPRLRQVVARVAHRDIGRWWSRVILAKGANHGIREGFAVVNGGGAVGRVVLTHAATCEVELISDPGFRISALLEGDESDLPVVYRGATAEAFVPPVGEVTNIPANFTGDPVRPIRVVTSGIGGVFPLAGITLGTLAAPPTVTADGLFREASVLVRPDLQDIREATVLVPVEDRAGEAP